MIDPVSHQQRSNWLVSTSKHPGKVTVMFRETILTLSWQDVDTLLNGKQSWWSAFYQIGLFDVRDTCIRTGFRGLNLPVTLREYDELILALQEASLNDD